jgi:hypothetical protein
MAIHNVVSSAHKQLASNVVDTVNMSGFCGTIRVYNRDTTLDIYYRIDGVNPTVAGDECDVLPPGNDVLIGMGDPTAPTIKLICSGNATYSVECVG